jgi:hypothetical protein
MQIILKQQLKSMLILGVNLTPKIWVIIFIFLLSCGKNDQYDSDNIIAHEIISINPLNAQKVNYSQIFSAVDYIPIPTDNDFLIGNIDKLLVTENNVLIMDKYITHSVFIFDKMSTKKIQLYKQGNGPGEYISMQDVFFDSDKQEVAIYCNMRKKLLYYNLEGKFVREKPVSFFGARFSPVGKNEVMFCEYFINHTGKKRKKYPNIILSSRIGDIKSSADFFFEDVDVSIVWSSLPDFSKVDERVVSIKPDHCNIVYHVSEDSIFPAYQLDFGKYNIDARYWKKARENNVTLKRVDDYCNSLELCESYCILEDADYLFFNYKQKNKIYTAFYSKKTKKLINANAFMNDMDQITAFYPIYIQDKKIYCILSSEDIITAKSYLTQNKLLPADVLNNVQEFDNPVIAVFTLKDF